MANVGDGEAIPAVQAVFETVELLEMILGMLTRKRLLRVQSVCRQWRAASFASQRLQEALFLRGQPGVRVKEDFNRDLRVWQYRTDVVDSRVIIPKENPFLRHILKAAKDGNRTVLRTKREGFKESWHDMHLTSPPINNVSGALWVKGLRTTRGGPRVKKRTTSWEVRRVEGVRIGDVLDKLENVRWELMKDGQQVTTWAAMAFYIRNSTLWAA